MKNPWDVSGFKHDNRLKCHRGIVSQWMFQVGLNVTVDETWVDVTSRHHLLHVYLAVYIHRCHFIPEGICGCLRDQICIYMYIRIYIYIFNLYMCIYIQKIRSLELCIFTESSRSEGKAVIG
jgi:hypothetical protein